MSRAKYRKADSPWVWLSAVSALAAAACFVMQGGYWWCAALGCSVWSLRIALDASRLRTSGEADS